MPPTLRDCPAHAIRYLMLPSRWQPWLLHCNHGNSVAGPERVLEVRRRRECHRALARHDAKRSFTCMHAPKSE